MLGSFGSVRWNACVHRQVNAGNKNTPSMHHPRTGNVTTSMVDMKNDHIHKNLTLKMVHPGDIAGNSEEEGSSKTCTGTLCVYGCVYNVKKKNKHKIESNNTAAQKSKKKRNAHSFCLLTASCMFSFFPHKAFLSF